MKSHPPASFSKKKVAEKHLIFWAKCISPLTFME